MAGWSTRLAGYELKYEILANTAVAVRIVRK
jgi:hypothetical protein